MNGWDEGITNAIAYIEENLTEDIDINEIAGKAYVSSFYFQIQEYLSYLTSQ